MFGSDLTYDEWIGIFPEKVLDVIFDDWKDILWIPYASRKPFERYDMHKHDGAWSGVIIGATGKYYNFLQHKLVNGQYDNYRTPLISEKKRFINDLIKYYEKR